LNLLRYNTQKVTAGIPITSAHRTGEENVKNNSAQQNTAAAAFVETQILTGYDSRNSNHE
jgi:hypothetical protein